ncbi:MAG: hypothetical protein KDC83_12020 [Flavobacteriales bacterium]|nr:hypothetical protein [Flavobacteriales bacterium]
MPSLIVVAGCNGSGNSTYSKAISPDNITPFDYDQVFLNIYHNLLEIDIKDEMAHAKSRAELLFQVEQSIKNRIDFCYETNFNSTPMYWPDRFKMAGYDLTLIYF